MFRSFVSTIRNVSTKPAIASTLCSTTLHLPHSTVRLARLSPAVTCRPRLYGSSVSPDDSVEFGEMMQRVTPLLQDFIEQTQNDPDTKTLVPKTMQEVSQELSVGRLTERSDGMDMDELMGEVTAILENSVRTQRPEYMDKLSAGSDAIGQVTGLLLSVLNNNVHTFRTSPALSTIEKSVSQALCQVYFKDSAPNAEGVFVPGGTYTVFKAIRLARDKKFPEFLTEGIGAFKNRKQPVILASDQMHYSVMLGAQTVGLGSEGVVKIKTNLHGQMDMDHLYETLRKMRDDPSSNQEPFLISCLAGSTVFGGFDDFPRIREICDEFGLLMHVDACWGGSVAFCKEKDVSGLMHGAELADFIGFDAHKLLGMPLICSAFLTRDGTDLLRSCTPMGADYIFHSELATPDIGPRTLQCGRHGDALKVYLAWLNFGEQGLSDRVSHCMQNSRTLYQLLQRDSRFVTVQPPEAPPMYANVSFWHVGEGSPCAPYKQDVLDWRDSGYSSQFEPKLAASLDELRRCLQQSTVETNASMKLDGKWAIDYSPMEQLGLPHFFRAVTGNYRLTQAHLEDLLETITETAIALKNESVVLESKPKILH